MSHAATKGTLTDLSKILYVELLTPDGFLVERQQLEMPNGTANGAFVLTDSLYAGYYELRAYTRWMLNFGQYEHPHAQWSEDAFYNKEMAKDFFRDYENSIQGCFRLRQAERTGALHQRHDTTSFKEILQGTERETGTRTEVLS